MTKDLVPDVDGKIWGGKLGFEAKDLTRVVGPYGTPK